MIALFNIDISILFVPFIYSYFMLALLIIFFYYYQQQMKINFDDLFYEANSSITIPLSLTTMKQQTQKTVATKNHIRFQSQEHLLNNNHNTSQSFVNGLSVLEKLSKLTSLIEKKQKKEKRQSKVNIKELTDKLYNPAPSHKKNCTKNIIKKQVQPTTSNVRFKEFKPSPSRKSSRAETSMPGYVRLFNLSKVRSIQQFYKVQSQQKLFAKKHSRQIIKTRASQSYLQSYVPFYDRLEHQISKSQEKQKFYQKNPQYSLGQHNQLFKPITIPSKYKNKVKSRYRKKRSNESKTTRELQQFFTSSMNTSYSLDRSIEIVNQVEQHFIERMKVIFENGKGQYVIVGQQIVKILSDVQFRILQDFIMQIESNPIKNEDFQDCFRHYYFNLSPHQRVELRGHFTKKRSKVVEQSSKMTLQNSRYVKPSREQSQKISKYHKKVQNFV